MAENWHAKTGNMEKKCVEKHFWKYYSHFVVNIRGYDIFRVSKKESSLVPNFHAL